MQTTDMHSVPNGSGTVLVQRERERENKLAACGWQPVRLPQRSRPCTQTHFAKVICESLCSLGLDWSPGGLELGDPAFHTNRVSVSSRLLLHSMSRAFLPEVGLLRRLASGSSLGSHSLV